MPSAGAVHYTLTRAAVVKLRDKNYLRCMAAKQARVALVSGGLEPVADTGGGGNSPFARAFIQALSENTRSSMAPGCSVKYVAP